MIVSAVMVLFAIGAQDSGPDARPWQVYVSKEGQFIVEFPKAPTGSTTKTQNGPDGRFTVVSVDCDTPSVAYIAQKITVSTAVLKGAEENQLDATRNYYAKQFNGKLVTEKKVRYEGRPGRDFTLRVQPERGGPIGVVRIRQYLSGQAIYALIAVSAPNRQLPEDAGRFFGSFSIGTTRIKKSGPKPEVAGKELAGWGSAIDPDGDCKIAPDGKALAIEIPGKLHDLNADIDKYNAPRVLREVDGNFSVQVKIVGDFKPGAKSLNPKSVPFNGAGLFVWRDSDNYIRLERAAIIRKGKPGTFAVFEEREGGTRGAMHNGSLTPGTAYLRLERRAGRLFGFTSKDGQHWAALKPIDINWPPQLKVGVHAINSSDAPFSVRFEDFVFKGKEAGATASRP